ncbi:hypothetical protein CsSME_00048338 [Camellia sinensis var. sinensis]
MQEALVLPDNSQNGKSLEEKDHLVRSTKKIKNTKEHAEDQDMNNLIQDTIEEQTKRSFKQALTSTKINKKAFGNDQERLSDDGFLTEEEDNMVMEDQNQIDNSHSQNQASFAIHQAHS